MRLLLLAALLLPAIATAADGDPYATVESVRARRAGFLEEVKDGKGDVVVVRGSDTLPMTRGMQVLEGDAVRTRAGECLLVTTGGWRIGVGEESELVVRPKFVHRLGEVVYKVKAAMGVEVERVEVLVEGTTFRVQRGEAGALQLHEGRVRLRGTNEVVVQPGQAVDFALDGAIQPPRPMAPKDRKDLTRSVRRLTRSDGGRPLRMKRFHVMLGQGGAMRQGDGWSSTQLGLQARLLGPIWFDIDAGLLARPIDLGPDVVASTLAFPVSFGPRLAGSLGGKVYGRVGASFTMLFGDRCIDGQSCDRQIEPQPGGTVDFAVGLAFGRLVLELQGEVGVERQHFYDFDASQLLEIPAGQLLGGLSVGLRL